MFQNITKIFGKTLVGRGTSALIGAPLSGTGGFVKGVVGGYKATAGRELGKAAINQASTSGTIGQVLGTTVGATARGVQEVGLGIGGLAYSGLSEIPFIRSAFNRKTVAAFSKGVGKGATGELKKVPGMLDSAWDLATDVVSENADVEQMGFRAFNRQIKPAVAELATTGVVVGGGMLGVARGAMNPSPMNPYMMEQAQNLPGVMAPPRSAMRGGIDDMGATGDLVFALNNMR